MNIDLKTLLNWSAPKRVNTKNGERDLLTAAPTDAFRKLWATNKAQLKELGISWGQDNHGNWEVLWWRSIDPAEAKAKAAAIAASKAVDAAIELPVNQGLAYLGYQKAGIAFALQRQGTFIGDEMGLGKTIQAIGVINADKSIKSVLIVCPASLKLNWVRELNKWLTRKFSIQVVGSGIGWRNSANLTIINYEMLSKHEAKVTGQEFDLVVIDESHMVKNPKAQRTQVFAQIKGKRRIAMTGTPILNRPVELWTTLFWLDPARWTKKKSFFEKRYCGAYMGQWGWYNEGASHLDELQEVLRSSVLVRRLKKDVLTELPPKQRQVVEVEGDENARRIARAELEKWEEFEGLIKEAKAAMMQAQEGTDAYKLAVEQLKDAQSIAFESMSRVRHDTAVAKLPFVIDFVREILEGSAEKLVIFAHHHDVIDGLWEALKEFGPVKLVGGMTEKAKQTSVDIFQTEPQCRVFIGSTLAAGVGITLTAASHVVFAELDWTPGRVTQAEDRCHRIGQHDSVLVQHLVLEGSLDARMAQMIVDKQDIQDKALDKAGKKIEVKEQKTTIAVNVAAQEEGEKPAMNQSQIDAAHQAMRILAGMCDGARSWDDVGFNKLDTVFGKSLAAQQALTVKQGMIAAKLANKYRRQLPEELLQVIKGKG